MRYTSGANAPTNVDRRLQLIHTYTRRRTSVYGCKAFVALCR